MSLAAYANMACHSPRDLTLSTLSWMLVLQDKAETAPKQMSAVMARSPMPMYTTPPPPIDNDDGISNDGELSVFDEQLLTAYQYLSCMGYLSIAPFGINVVGQPIF